MTVEYIRPQQIRRELLRIIEKHPGIPSSSTRVRKYASIKLSDQMARYHLDRLEASGQIENVNGRYYIGGSDTSVKLEHHPRCLCKKCNGGN